MKSLVFTFVLFAILASGCSTTTMRVHPSLDAELAQIDRVVIAPPEVQINLVKFKGDNERMTEKEQEYKSELVKHVQSRLESAQYDVVEFDFDTALKDDEEFAYLVNQIREDFEHAKKDLRAGQPISTAQAKALKAEVGEAVRKVAARSGADAVMLVRCEGFQKSGGQVAKDVGASLLVGILTMGSYVPVQASAGALVEMALIDGVTGEVLWTDVKAGALDHQLANTTLKTLPPDVDPATGEQSKAVSGSVGAGPAAASSVK